MFKVGDKVNFHSIIGGDITTPDHIIQTIQRMPNNFGCDVAWISGRSGCVALDALSNEANPPKIYEKISRSKKRYQEYLKSEVSESFPEWLGINA
jgi:hypothetical protein